MTKLALPAVFATVAIAVLAAAGGPAVAQDVNLPFQVADRAEALRLVVEFERHAKAGEWPRAVDKLQKLLDVPADQAVVIRATGSAMARFEGAGVVARRLFDGLPAAGLAAWEAHSRVRAEELLARGLRLRREQDLRETARRFPAPDIRRRAHDALAQLALVRADLADAQFQLVSLLAATEPADRPQVLARLAWVAAQAGDAEGFAKVRAMAEPVRGTSVASGTASELLGALVDRMAKMLAGPAAAGAARQFGGDSHGSGLSETPPQPGSRQWRAVTEFKDGLENDEEWGRFSYRDRARMAPVVPLVSQGLVFVNNGLSLFAVNLSSGVTSWRHDAPQQEAEWRDSFVQTNTVAVADGVVYAALATRADKGDPGFERHFMRYTILYPMPHRCLHAFDERTGELLWSHDTSRLAAGREDAETISKECVSSPPLVVGDDVIVTAWVYEGIYELRVVCYDRRTGRTRWRTSVVQAQQELNLFGRPVKELSTGPLAERNGRIFFSTGLGVAAAVEREDGRIAWISAYPQTPLPKAYRWFETHDRDVTWWPSPVAATDDAVVMAPVDCQELLSFDPATGALRWRLASTDAPASPRRDGRRTTRWFLGVTGGRAYVLETKLTIVDVATGKAVPGAGSGTFDASGRGLLTRDRVYVPTDKEVLVLSASSAALEARWPLVTEDEDAPGTGSLVSGDGALLFVDRSRIDACYRFEDLRGRLEGRLAQYPNDPQVRLEAGLAYASAGRVNDAITTFEQAMSLLPQAPARVRERVEDPLRHALYNAHVARAESRAEAGDADGAAADLRAAAAVARERDDVVRALFALADALDGLGRRADADAALRRVAEEFPDATAPARDGEPAQAGPLARLRLGDSALRAGRPADAVKTWLDLVEGHADADLGATDVATTVRERLANLAQTEPEVVASAVRARAQKAFEAAKAAGDAAALARTARLYPDPQFGGEAALLAAGMYLAAKAPRDAVGVLRAQLGESPPPPMAARLRWTLAEAYRTLGETSRERAELRRLAKETPGEVVEDGMTAADAAKRELAAPRFQGGSSSLPDPKPPLDLLWQVGGPDQIAHQVLRLAGSLPPEMAGRVVVTRPGIVSLVDSATGTPLWEQPLRVEIRCGAATPGAVVVAGRDSATRDRAVVVMGLALSDGHTLWRQRIAGDFRAAEAALGILYVLSDDVATPGARPNTSLTAVALAAGELLGSRNFGGPLRTSLTTAEDTVVVTEPVRGKSGPRRAIVTIDGTSLGRRGRVELAAPSSPWCLHPPLSSVVVTSDGADLVAVDVTRGDLAWRHPLADGSQVKALFGVPGGVVVSDDANAVRLLDADTGREVWKTPLGDNGSLAFNGEAAEGDLVVATLRRADGSEATAIALDAATGRERWRTSLPVAEENTYPHVLGSAVAYDLNERLDRGARSRVLFLDRATGAVVQAIEHPTIGLTYQSVEYGPDWVVVYNPNELAMYGRPRAPSAK